MRFNIWSGATMLTLAATIGWLSLSSLPAAAAAAPAKADIKAPLDDRDELCNKLMERVTIDKAMEKVPLKEVLDYLSEKHGITLLVDLKSFRIGDQGAVALNAADDNEALLTKAITLPAMKKVRLSTVLKYVANQIDGVYMLKADHIRFVGLDVAMSKSIIKLRHYTAFTAGDPASEEVATLSPTEIFRHVPLVSAHFSDRPLQEVLREIESRANWTVVLATQVDEKGKTPITARFANVPVDTAVATIAEMAGLKMARKGNVLLVTTEERAKAFDPPAPPIRQGFGGISFEWPANVTLESQIGELTKKIGELEKVIAESKKEKPKN